MPLLKGQIVRRDTSLGVHVRGLAELLAISIADERDGLPSERRVRLRNHLAALMRAYPECFATDSDVAQFLAEEDGDAIDEAI